MAGKDVVLKREALKKVFPTQSWAEKVKNMPDSQVIAVYLRLKNQNKL